MNTYISHYSSQCEEFATKVAGLIPILAQAIQFEDITPQDMCGLLQACTIPVRNFFFLPKAFVPTSLCLLLVLSEHCSRATSLGRYP